MAVNVNTNALPEKGKESNPETKFIKAGNRLARFVSYIELGKHYQLFKGARAKYENGKKAGLEKPPVLHVALTFEFPGEEYTGDYPLTISTTRRMDNGEFFDAVTVPESLANGTMARAYALKTRFVKYLTSIQAATEMNYTNLADFAKKQVPLMINVTNKLGAKKEDGSQPTYANMKPDGIVAPQMENPVTSEVQKFDVPDAKGEYCAAFEWDAPTEESWKALPPWHKDSIKKAVDFDGSPIDVLLRANPEWDQVTEPDAGQDQSAPQEPPAGVTTQPMQEDIPV